MVHSTLLSSVTRSATAAVRSSVWLRTSSAVSGLAPHVRALHASTRCNQELETPQPASLYNFTEEELMLKEAVANFSNSVVKPKVTEMDEAEQVDPAVLQGLFDQGLMGVETPVEFEG
ncbi:hypothetical protein IWQ61_009621, partial [Dispira simplex]